MGKGTMDLLGARIGHLRIDDLLGEGGMGRVYRGFDERLQRPVAIKTVRLSGEAEEAARQRFVEEARVLSRLNHPNICQIYDLVRDGPLELLVLELVEGRTLTAAMAGGLSSEEKMRVALAVVEAVTAAHRESIVHRDLKPDNIMITAEGGVKVLDFGLAQSAAALGAVRSVAPRDPSLFLAEDPDRTVAEPVRLPAARAEQGAEGSDRERTAVGTLSYMSPEQARLDTITMASDIYSLGVVLQELFTGRRAFAKGPPEELLERVRQGRTEPCDDLDAELAALIRAMQDPDPLRRPAASEVSRRLSDYQSGPSRRRRRRLQWTSAALLALFAVGSVLVSRFQAGRQALLAQEFTAEANDMESALRMAYLAPVHDLRPTFSTVRQRMAALDEKMRAQRSVGRGPGEYALGRVALALEDYHTARRHFQAAWNADYRTPEVASGLGVATFELYRLELSRLERDGGSSPGDLDRLHRTLRDPSIGYLGVGQNALSSAALSASDGDVASIRRPTESLDYVEALRAFNEGDLDEALARATASVAGAPLFFQGNLLEGKILRARGNRFQGNSDYPRAVLAYDAAQASLEAAAMVGRSAPGIFLELCELARDRMVLELYSRGEGNLERPFVAGKEVCGTVLTLDPDHARARYLLAELILRRAEGDGPRGQSQPSLETAPQLLDESLLLDRSDAEAWKILGHLEMLQSDWLVYYGRVEGQEATERVRRAQNAYNEAHRLEPEDTRILNALANSYALEGEILIREGRDPRSVLGRSMEVYRQAIALGPEETFPRSNLLLALASQVRYEVSTGKDPTSTLATSRKEFRSLLDAAAEGG
ncbi:MAG: protein kinase, partial [Acidobacteria bacterium]|nr:protein kinase [Acidobacteriota bacterium]